MVKSSTAMSVEELAEEATLLLGVNDLRTAGGDRPDRKQPA